jgi:hypothetical protein
MDSADLNVIDGAAAGAWIKPRLGGEFGAVTLQVPKGYEAYARVFHPASDPDGNPVRWAEVAETVGTTAHREMQWHALVGSSDTYSFTGSKWVGGDPRLGAMDLPTLDGLCKVLAAHTAERTHCAFGLCTIQGWEDQFSRQEGRRPLELAMGRDHIVLVGSLAAVDQIAIDWSKPSQYRVRWVAHRGEGPPPEPDACEQHSRQAPNLIWPDDHSWLVASEVDFDSTLVGGTQDLINAIVKSPELEAWKVEPTDSLAADADKVNLAPENDT